jgi:hypothetical protein
MFTLMYVIILIFANILDNVIGTTFEIAGTNLGYGWVYLIVGLCIYYQAFLWWLEGFTM